VHLYRIKAIIILPALDLSALFFPIAHSNRRSQDGSRVAALLRGREVLASASSWERWIVRYIVAWVLGVPFGLIVIWYVVGHAACGR
jgi:hypothetical protein